MKKVFLSLPMSGRTQENKDKVKYMLLDKYLAIPYKTKDIKEANDGKEENN